MRIKLKLPIFSSLIFITIIFSKLIYAQEFSEKGFANFLFERGEYYRAITEYYRILYSKKDTTQEIDLLRKIGLCYFQGEDFKGYISFLKKNRNLFQKNSGYSTEMDYYLGRSYYNLEEYPKAITNLEWRKVIPDNPYYSEFNFLLAISYARIFKYQIASKKIKLVKPDSPKKEIAERFDLYLKDLSEFDEKSPFFAGTLSAIIPGSGYIYSDRVGTGLTSFLINGLLIWSIRDAIKDEQYGLASAIGFFGVGWYMGNISGSVTAAEEYNAKTRNEIINEFLEKENLIEYIKPVH